MLNAHNQIVQLLYLYAEYIDDGKLEAVAKLFCHGKIIANGGNEFVGEEAILALYQSSTRLYKDSNTPKTQHIISNPIVNIDGDGRSACSRSRFTVFQATDKISLQPIITGRYHDKFKLIDGQWSFTERHMATEMLGDLSHHLLFDQAIIE